MQSNEVIPAIAEPERQLAPYFTVGAVKFSLMSLATFGIYELYWFYRNWRIIRDREQSQLSPFWRAVFTPIWTFSMGARFTKEAKAQSISLRLPVLALGACYFLLQACARLPDPWWLVSLLSFVPLLPFEFAARRLDGKGQLAVLTFGRYSAWNITGLIIGLLWVAIAVLGTFLQSTS